VLPSLPTNSEELCCKWCASDVLCLASVLSDGQCTLYNTTNVDSVSRQSLGWELGSRGDGCARRLIQKVDTGSCSFVTDEWPGFFRLLPEDRHFYGKDLTFPIEASNGDIRHRLARFVRKTKASSRSLHMVHLSLALTHHLQNPDALQSYLQPFISIFS